MELFSQEETLMKIIGFTNPVWLILLIGLVPLWYWSKISNADISSSRRIISLILRMVIYTFLVFALAGLRFYLPTDRLCVIFLVDDSASTPSQNRQIASRYIEESIRKARHDDVIKVALFGEDVFLDQAIEGSGQTSPFSTVIKREHTDLSQAISFAEALFPQDCIRRIVLLSDGNENSGNAIREALLARSHNIEIWTVPYPQGGTAEVMLQGVSVPERVNIDEAFDLKLVIESNIATNARARIFLNGASVAEETLELHQGENVFFIPQKAFKAGTYSYEAVIEPEKDCLMKNNRGTAVTFVEGKPRILYLCDFGAKPGPLPDILKKAGLTVDVGTPQNLPVDLAAVKNYHTIIFSNISALSLSPRHLSLIKSFVQDLGGGFVMTGGLNSFGVGGYYSTPVEEVLPVDMDVRKRKIFPQTALILVIDKSGSMSEVQGKREKIDLAREAAIVTLDLLSPQDIIGVIAFDSASKWLITPKSAANKKPLIDEIASLRAGGGTSLYPALDSSIDKLKELKAPIKHIIVLSDGRTEPGNFDKLLESMKAGKITLSSVSVGKDADIPFMQRIAREGKGRSYFTDDASLLPRIFLKDTIIASRSAYLEENFTPVMTESHIALSGLDLKGPPNLRGYDITVAKPLASVPLSSHKKDPVLALWRSGLGKSIAFTSDEGEKWAASWNSWKELEPFWIQLIRWSMPSLRNEAYSISTGIEGERCSVNLEAMDEEGNYLNFLNFNARVIPPDLEPFTVPLRQAGPGAYRCEFNTSSAGNYLIHIREAGGGSQFLAVSVPYSPEYRDCRTDSYLLHRVSDITGGRYNPREGDFFSRPKKKAYIPRDAWETLLFTALFLFPLDVALRRVFLPEGWLSRLLPQRESTKKSRKADQEQRATLSALKSVKHEVATQFKSEMREGDLITYADKTAEETLQNKDARIDTQKDRIEVKTPDAAPRENISRPAPSQQVDVKPVLSSGSISYLERLKQAKKKATETKDPQ